MILLIAGNGAGIGWTLIDDITYAEVEKEEIIKKTNIDVLVDYCLNSQCDGLRSAVSVVAINELIDKI